MLYEFYLLFNTNLMVLKYLSSIKFSNGNHDIWYLILISIDFLRVYFSLFSLVFVSIEKIYQTLDTAFDYISKHLEVR